MRRHDEVDFDYGANYLGIARSDDLVIIQLTVNNTRTLAFEPGLQENNLSFRETDFCRQRQTRQNLV
jgi:hypothetical protein